MPISKKAIEDRQKTFKALQKMHPQAWTELNFKSPWQLLVAVILSAQATDKLVNTVTPGFFKKYEKVSDVAKASVGKLDKAIARVNFHSQKAKSLKGAAEMLVRDHKGIVPDSMVELVKLPGVGRKTANVILGHAFKKAEGVVVDTHVARLANRFGWTKQADPVKIEEDLMKLFPKKQWTELSDLLIHHGRYVCKARNPQCADCLFPEPFCPSRH